MDHVGPYDGDVTPGGPTAIRELPRLTIRKASVSRTDNNVYLLTCTASGAQLLIDAADDSERLGALIDEGTGRLDAIATTHQHWDHTRALADLVAWTSAPTYAGSLDAGALPVDTTHLLDHGDTVRFGDITLDVVGLRGHTPGGIALVYRDDTPGGIPHLFVGDSLFPGGIGNTSMAGQSFEQLYADVVARLFDVYADDTWVYPGHGADTTLGRERPHLAEWHARGW